MSPALIADQLSDVRDEIIAQVTLVSVDHGFGLCEHAGSKISHVRNGVELECLLAEINDIDDRRIIPTMTTVNVEHDGVYHRIKAVLSAVSHSTAIYSLEIVD